MSDESSIRRQPALHRLKALATALSALGAGRAKGTARASSDAAAVPLNGEQQAFLDYYPPTNVFAVITWGCAATSWLAHTLNSHPDVYCVHAGNLFWHRLGHAPYIDGVPYLRLIGSQGYACKLAGDVHGVSRHLVPELRSFFGDKFGCAAVVLEPMRRLASVLGLFESFKQFRSWDVSYLDGLIESGIGLPRDTYENRLFVHGVNMLNSVIEENQIARVFRAEDLVSKPEVLVELVGLLSGGGVEASAAWADSAISRPPINSHSRRSAREPGFLAWQQHVIRKVVKHEAWQIYAGLGYSVYPLG